MKTKLTLKDLLLATLLCTILVIVKNVFGPRWTSPRDFLTIIYLILLVIGWAVYFLEKFKNK